ncbi:MULTISPECIES: hypothetical protein, partial [unclassified Microcoleus]|uniref:hypothetical protein n=1 Tax=unclassified Microcoleus TaxID=2642155 RepID=UPI002FCF1B5B
PAQPTFFLSSVTSEESESVAELPSSTPAQPTFFLSSVTSEESESVAELPSSTSAISLRVAGSGC